MCLVKETFEWGSMLKATKKQTFVYKFKKKTNTTL